MGPRRDIYIGAGNESKHGADGDGGSPQDSGAGKQRLGRAGARRDQLAAGKPAEPQDEVSKSAGAAAKRLVALQQFHRV